MNVEINLMKQKYSCEDGTHDLMQQLDNYVLKFCLFMNLFKHSYMSATSTVKSLI